MAERNICRNTTDLKSLQGMSQRLEGLAPIFTPYYQFRNHRIVEHGDMITGTYAGIDSHPSVNLYRGLHVREQARRGKEPAFWALL